MNSNKDAGDGSCTDADCTLRAAIEQANKSVRARRNLFREELKIQIGSALPVITDTVSIIGSALDTEPVCPGFQAPADLKVELTAAGSAAAFDGLVLGPGSDGSKVQGLAIHGFGGSGLVVQSDGNEIVCNHIGTNLDGSSVDGNAHEGILINNAQNNTIGGDTFAARNVIAANGGNGVFVFTGEYPWVTDSDDDDDMAAVAAVAAAAAAVAAAAVAGGGGGGGPISRSYIVAH